MDKGVKNVRTCDDCPMMAILDGMTEQITRMKSLVDTCVDNITRLSGMLTYRGCDDACELKRKGVKKK